MSAELLRGLAEELRERIDWNRDVRAADLVRRAEEAAQPPQDECGRGRYGDGYANGWGDHLRLTDSLLQPPQDERGQPEQFQKDGISRMVEEVGGLQVADNVFQLTRSDLERYVAASAPQPVALSTLTDERLKQVRQIIRRAIVTHCMGDDLDTSVWYAADKILTGESQWPRPSFQDNFIADRD